MCNIQKTIPFKGKVGELYDTGCLIFCGKIDKKNGCRVTFKGKQTIAHRLAYHLATGEELSDTDVIKHTCKYINCVNPEHLIKAPKSPVVSEDQKDNIKVNYLSHIPIEELALKYDLPKSVIKQIVEN